MSAATTVIARLENSQTATETEGALVLAGIEAMSQENRADTPMDRPAGSRSPPWLVALVGLLRSAEWGTSDAEVSSRWVLPVYDGDRPSDLSDEMIAAARTWQPEYRHRSRALDGAALVHREWHHDRGRGDGYAASVRETHRAVHRALTGEDTRGCRWCEEATR